MAQQRCPRFSSASSNSLQVSLLVDAHIRPTRFRGRILGLTPRSGTARARMSCDDHLCHMLLVLRRVPRPGGGGGRSRHRNVGRGDRDRSQRFARRLARAAAWGSWALERVGLMSGIWAPPGAFWPATASVPVVDSANSRVDALKQAIL